MHNSAMPTLLTVFSHTFLVSPLAWKHGIWSPLDDFSWALSWLMHFGWSVNSFLVVASYRLRRAQFVSYTLCSSLCWLGTQISLFPELSYACVDVLTNFWSVCAYLLFHGALHVTGIHTAVYAIRLTCLSDILWPSVLPLCKYYLHVLSLWLVHIAMHACVDPVKWCVN